MRFGEVEVVVGEDGRQRTDDEVGVGPQDVVVVLS